MSDEERLDKLDADVAHTFNLIDNLHDDIRNIEHKCQGYSYDMYELKQHHVDESLRFTAIENELRCTKDKNAMYQKAIDALVTQLNLKIYYLGFKIPPLLNPSAVEDEIEYVAVCAPDKDAAELKCRNLYDRYFNAELVEVKEYECVA